MGGYPPFIRGGISRCDSRCRRTSKSMVAWGPRPPSTAIVFMLRRHGGAAGATPRLQSGHSPHLAVQVLRDARRSEDVVARVLELPSQTVHIDVEQLPLPFAHLARNDHRLDVGAVH